MKNNTISSFFLQACTTQFARSHTAAQLKHEGLDYSEVRILNYFLLLALRPIKFELDVQILGWPAFCPAAPLGREQFYKRICQLPSSPFRYFEAMDPPWWEMEYI